jgi:hypothetical protein
MRRKFIEWHRFWLISKTTPKYIINIFLDSSTIYIDLVKKKGVKRGREEYLYFLLIFPSVCKSDSRKKRWKRNWTRSVYYKLIKSYQILLVTYDNCSGIVRLMVLKNNIWMEETFNGGEVREHDVTSQPWALFVITVADASLALIDCAGDVAAPSVGVTSFVWVENDHVSPGTSNKREEFLIKSTWWFIIGSYPLI